MPAGRMGAVGSKPAVAASGGPPVPAANSTTWWADDLALGDGAAVSTWAPREDRIGFGNLTQGTGANQPTYRASHINTRPAVQGDATNDVLSTGTISAVAQPFTVAIVAKVGTLFNIELFGTVSTTNQVLIDDTGGAGDNLRVVAGGSIATTSLALTAGRNFLIVAVANGASSTIHVDGTANGSGNAGTNGLASVQMFRQAGADYGDNGNAFCQVVAGTYSGAELTALKSWVSTYYGLTIA